MLAALYPTAEQIDKAVGWARMLSAAEVAANRSSSVSGVRLVDALEKHLVDRGYLVGRAQLRA